MKYQYIILILMLTIGVNVVIAEDGTIQSDTWCKSFRLQSVIVDTNGTRILAATNASGTTFSMRPGETRDGITLNEVLVDTKNNEVSALFSKEGQMARIYACTPATSSATRSTGMYKRMAIKGQGTQTNSVTMNPEHFEKSLKEYQMRMIREGKPPLPIPLTREMDDQLVKEGVLPPLEPVNRTNTVIRYKGSTNTTTQRIHGTL